MNNAPNYYQTANPARETTLIQRVSYLLSTCLLTTAGAAYWADSVHLSPALFLPLSIGTVVCAFAISFTRGIPALSLLLLYSLSLLEGLVMGPLLGAIANGLPNGAQIIGEAAALSAILVVGLGSYVWISGKDFGGLGKFLTIGLIALLIVGLIGMFVHFGAAGSLLYAVVGAAIFIGFTLYDFSNIKLRYGPEDYVIATVQIYLDFINLFWFLLQILLAFGGGGSRRSD